LKRSSKETGKSPGKDDLILVFQVYWSTQAKAPIMTKSPAGFMVTANRHLDDMFLPKKKNHADKEDGKMNFLGGWFDVEPGRHDEIEGIGRFVLFPLEFISELIEVAKEEVKDLRRSPKQRLAALEHDYRMANARQEEMKKRQGKLQKFILANKEKVKARLERAKENFRRDYNDVKDLIRDLAFEGLYEVLESETYGKFQAKVHGTYEKEVKIKEKDLMQPKVIRLPQYAESATPDFILRKTERDSQPDPVVTEEAKEVEREEVPEFVRRHKEKHGQPMEQEQEKEKEIIALPDPEAKKKETSFPKAPEPVVIEAEWEEVKEEKKPSKAPTIEIEGPEFV
jgi:hypothetical protein